MTETETRSANNNNNNNKTVEKQLSGPVNKSVRSSLVTLQEKTDKIPITVSMHICDVLFYTHTHTHTHTRA